MKSLLRPFWTLCTTASIALPGGSLLKAETPQPWGVGISLCQGVGDAKDLYGSGFGVEGSYQFRQGDVLDGRVRLSYFAFQKGSGEFPPIGRLDASVDGFTGTYDFIWNLGKNSSSHPYLVLGLGAASYVFEHKGWQYTQNVGSGQLTSTVPAGKDQNVSFLIAPGLGWRANAQLEFELRYQHVKTPVVDDIAQAFNGLSGAPDFAPNHLSLTARMRF